MRDRNPGDLAVRLVFSRVYGSGPDSGQVRPSIEISDGTSGLSLNIELTPHLLTEMLGGGSAEVTADKVQGFKGLRDWGKHLKTMSKSVSVEQGDYKHKDDPETLPHVAKAIAEITAAGYIPGTPRMNNAQKWVITGRRYDDQP
jgi:hypothetical protein